VNYEIFDTSLTLIGAAAELVAPRGPDAVGIAKAHKAPCIIVRVADNAVIAGYGRKPALLMRRWDAEMLPGVKRMAA